MIAVLGISHLSANVSIRELFSFNENEKVAFAGKVKDILGTEGMVILSTCNRTEIYLNTRNEDPVRVFQLLMTELVNFRGLADTYRQYFYFYSKEQAVEQIFKVASGLESLVIGEEQILGQVKEAFSNAQIKRLTDCILSRLFTKAIETGKRVRTETYLNKGAASVSYATAELCQEIFPDLHDRSIMLIGAGETGELLLQCLVKKNHPHFIIANRTLSKAVKLAEKYSGTPAGLAEIDSLLPGCDIVIAATSSREHIVTRPMAELAAMKGLNNNKVYIDLSVPSNIDEGIKNLADIQYYGVDDLKAVVLKNIERRKSAIDHSMVIIREVLSEFLEWMDIQNLVPTIISIKENLRNIHQTELEGFIKYRKIKEHDLIDQYSEHISEKYTEIFIKKLKKVTENGKRPEYIKVINDLFESI